MRSNEYQAGTQAFTTVVTAEAQQLSAEESLLSTQAQIQTDAVNLIVALGGGWTESKLPDALADAAAPGPPLRSDHSDRAYRPAIASASRASDIVIAPLLAARALLTAFARVSGPSKSPSSPDAADQPIAHRRAHIVVGEGDGLHQGDDGPGRACAARQPVGVQEPLCAAGRMCGQRRERGQERGFRIG